MTEMTHFAHKDDPVKAVPYHYTQCGLSNIYLVNGYEIEQTDYGRTVSIQHADELHEIIGMHIVKYRKLLRPDEIRFLRKHLEMTQGELANLMGQSDQQIARWEKGECNIPGPADRLLRLIYLGNCRSKAQLVSFLTLLSQLHDLDETQADTLTFEETENGWAKTAA